MNGRVVFCPERSGCVSDSRKKRAEIQNRVRGFRGRAQAVCALATFNGKDASFRGLPQIAIAIAFTSTTWRWVLALAQA